MTDDGLLAAIATGDRGAYTAFYNRHRADVYGYCCSILGSDDAEDATQETMLRVWQKAGTYTTGTQARRWLFTIAIRCCIDAYRVRRNHDEFIEDLYEREAVFADPLLAEIIDREIARLPGIYRDAVRDRDKLDLTYAEMARKSGVNVSAIKFRLSRGRAMLRRRLFSHRI